MNEIATKKTFSLTPTSLDEAMKFADMIAKSDICPKDFKGNAGNVLVAVQMGGEIGLQPIQAIQNIAVINGRPSIWGDALPALARTHPHFEYMTETFDDGMMVATCRIKRKREPEQIRTFSQADAKLANLWGKGGPWTNYPKRMLAMRARGWAIRDVFPDALKGLQVAEEIIDYAPEKEMGDVQRVDKQQADKPEQTVLPLYQADQFAANYPAWKYFIDSNKKTPTEIINTIETKYTLTDAQKNKINGKQEGSSNANS